MKKIFLIFLVISSITFGQFKIKLLNEHKIQKLKFSQTYEVYPKDGKIATVQDINKIVKEIYSKNKGYEKYFLNFSLNKSDSGMNYISAENKFKNSSDFDINTNYDALYYDSNYKKFLGIDSNGNYFIKND